jgi:frataxin-like iron-binding protein CyaY
VKKAIAVTRRHETFMIRSHWDNVPKSTAPKNTLHVQEKNSVICNTQRPQPMAKLSEKHGGVRFEWKGRLEPRRSTRVWKP